MPTQSIRAPISLYTERRRDVHLVGRITIPSDPRSLTCWCSIHTWSHRPPMKLSACDWICIVMQGSYVRTGGTFAHKLTRTYSIILMLITGEEGILRNMQHLAFQNSQHLLDFMPTSIVKASRMFCTRCAVSRQIDEIP